MVEPRYWLFKSEPSAYSYSDLIGEDDRTAEWDGVRNYQARNFMRDEMKVGDRILFYHSEPGAQAVVGTARVVREAYPDHTAWDLADKHYDAKSPAEKPVWYMVDIQGETAFPRPVTLKEINEGPRLQSLGLVRKGNRLSIQPVTKQEWEDIVTLGNES